jgi:hypothetical protein
VSSAIFSILFPKQGAYELRLPPGKYEIAAWHEKYGSQTQIVEAEDNERKSIHFTFRAS